MPTPGGCAQPGRLQPDQTSAPQPVLGGQAPSSSQLDPGLQPWQGTSGQPGLASAGPREPPTCSPGRLARTWGLAAGTAAKVCLTGEQARPLLPPYEMLRALPKASPVSPGGSHLSLKPLKTEGQQAGGHLTSAGFGPGWKDWGTLGMPMSVCPWPWSWEWKISAVPEEQMAS